MFYQACEESRICAPRVIASDDSTLIESCVSGLDFAAVRAASGVGSRAALQQWSELDSFCRAFEQLGRDLRRLHARQPSDGRFTYRPTLASEPTVGSALELLAPQYYEIKKSLAAQLSDAQHRRLVEFLDAHLDPTLPMWANEEASYVHNDVSDDNIILIDDIDINVDVDVDIDIDIHDRDSSAEVANRRRFVLIDFGDAAFEHRANEFASLYRLYAGTRVWHWIENGYTNNKGFQPVELQAIRFFALLRLTWCFPDVEKDPQRAADDIAFILTELKFEI